MRLHCIVLLLLGPASALGADLSVTMVDQHGKPVADTVVSVVPEAGAVATGVPAPRGPRTKVINQLGLAFVPYIEIFRPSDQVVFRNSDKTRHHVYSFSPLKAFEFMLNPGMTSKPLVLDRSGVVAVGCNIHDPMITYLYVTDAPWIVRGGKDGKAMLRGIPAGQYTVRVWQPRLRPGRPDFAQSGVRLSASGDKALRFTLPLLPDSRRAFDREHTDY